MHGTAAVITIAVPCVNGIFLCQMAFQENKHLKTEVLQMSIKVHHLNTEQSPNQKKLE